jgi:hypothetical protein
MVFIHPIFQVFAIGIGLYTGYLGWQRFRRRKFQRKRHIRLGFTFFMMIVFGAFGGFGTTFLLEGGIFKTGLHGFLPFIIVPFLSIGATLGYLLSKGHGKRRLAIFHMCINFFTMLLILLQAYFGIEILMEIIRSK